MEALAQQGDQDAGERGMEMTWTAALDFLVSLLGNQRKVAAVVGVSPAAVTHWYNGMEPSVPIMLRLQELAARGLYRIVYLEELLAAKKEYDRLVVASYDVADLLGKKRELKEREVIDIGPKPNDRTIFVSMIVGQTITMEFTPSGDYLVFWRLFTDEDGHGSYVVVVINPDLDKVRSGSHDWREPFATSLFKQEDS